MTDRIAALAEALHPYTCSGKHTPDEEPKPPWCHKVAAAILAALDGSGWRLHARDKMCPHEAEIARLRAIEEAARKYLACDGSGIRAPEPWTAPYDAMKMGRALDALRAALGSER